MEVFLLSASELGWKAKHSPNDAVNSTLLSLIKNMTMYCNVIVMSDVANFPLCFGGRQRT